MAQQYLNARRGALYYITQSSDATYLAPDQATDKALQIMEITIALDGGAVRVEEDVTPYGGGLKPFLGDTAATWSAKIRVPAWPGSQNAADFPAMAALLASMPLSSDFSGSAAVFAPISVNNVGAAGDIKPASLTFLETGGNVWSLYDCVCIIDGIATEGGAIVMSVSGTGKIRGTSSYVTLATASLTIADVEYTAVSPIPSRGATLTITGATGSGTYAVRSAAFEPGMALEQQDTITETYGRAVSAVSCPRNSALSLTVTELSASGANWVTDLLSQTAISAASLAWGSSGSRFALGCGATCRVVEVTPKEDAGVRAFDLVIVGAATSGDDQFSLTWGTP